MKHEHKSAEWIAWNAAMDAKRPILGKGPRPKIGSMFAWDRKVMPAVEIYGRQHRRGAWREGLRDILMVIGAIAVFGLMLSVGVAIGM